MTHLETTLRTLAEDPFAEPAPANLADRALTRARQRSRRLGVLSVVGAAAAVALVAVGIVTTSNVTDQQQRHTSTPAATTPAFAKPRMNVLLIGSDAGPGRIGVRPDTILLASIDTRTGATTLLSLPRSLQRVPFPADSPGARAWPNGYFCPESGPGGECLLNAVWTWAEESREYRKDPNPGLTATTQVVEEISGLSVDETVVVTMRGLADLVDAVGGVEVTVRGRLPIGGSANDPVAEGWIEKGRQHLDGKTAVWFARSRWSTDDYDRIQRQQCLITALAQQVDARTLLTRYPQIARALGRDLNTSITPKDLASWADLALRMRNAPITRISEQMPGGTVNPDYAEIRRRVAKALQLTEALATTSPSSVAPSTDTSTPRATKARGTSDDNQWLRDDPC